MPTSLFMDVVPQLEVLSVAMPFVMAPATEAPAGNARIFTVVAVDSTHVRVTFVRPLEVNEALECTHIWLVDPPDDARPITVQAVTVEGDPCVSVLLTVDEMLDGADYGFTIAELQEA